MVGVAVIDALHIAGNAIKPGEAKQATEATQARQAEQTLAAGKETEEAKAVVHPNHERQQVKRAG